MIRFTSVQSYASASSDDTDTVVVNPEECGELETNQSKKANTDTKNLPSDFFPAKNYGADVTHQVAVIVDSSGVNDNISVACLCDLAATSLFHLPALAPSGCQDKKDENSFLVEAFCDVLSAEDHVSEKEEVPSYSFHPVHNVLPELRRKLESTRLKKDEGEIVASEQRLCQNILHVFHRLPWNHDLSDGATCRKLIGVVLSSQAQDMDMSRFLKIRDQLKDEPGGGIDLVFLSDDARVNRTKKSSELFLSFHDLLPDYPLFSKTEGLQSLPFRNKGSGSFKLDLKPCSSTKCNLTCEYPMEMNAAAKENDHLHSLLPSSLRPIEILPISNISDTKPSSSYFIWQSLDSQHSLQDQDMSSEFQTTSLSSLNVLLNMRKTALLLDATSDTIRDLCTETKRESRYFLLTPSTLELATLQILSQSEVETISNTRNPIPDLGKELKTLSSFPEDLNQVQRLLQPSYMELLCRSHSFHETNCMNEQKTSPTFLTNEGLPKSEKEDTTQPASHFLSIQSSYRACLEKDAPTPLEFITNTALQDGKDDERINFCHEELCIPYSEISREAKKCGDEKVDLERFLQVQVLLRMQLAVVSGCFSAKNGDIWGENDSHKRKSKAKRKNRSIGKITQSNHSNYQCHLFSQNITSILSLVPFVLSSDVQLCDVIKNWIWHPFHETLPDIVNKVYDFFEVKIPSQVGTADEERSPLRMLSLNKANIIDPTDEPGLRFRRSESLPLCIATLSEKPVKRDTDKLLRSISLPHDNLTNDDGNDEISTSFTRSLSDPIVLTEEDKPKSKKQKVSHDFQSITLKSNVTKRKNPFLGEKKRYVGNHFTDKLSNISTLFHEVKMVKNKNSKQGADEKSKIDDATTFAQGRKSAANSQTIINSSSTTLTRRLSFSDRPKLFRRSSQETGKTIPLVRSRKRLQFSGKDEPSSCENTPTKGPHLATLVAEAALAAKMKKRK